MNRDELIKTLAAQDLMRHMAKLMQYKPAAFNNRPATLVVEVAGMCPTYAQNYVDSRFASFLDSEYLSVRYDGTARIQWVDNYRPLPEPTVVYQLYFPTYLTAHHCATILECLYHMDLRDTIDECQQAMQDMINHYAALFSHRLRVRCPDGDHTK